MNDDFATAMRRSLALTRAGDPGAATRAIQEHLNGGTMPAATATRTLRTRAPLGDVLKGLAGKVNGMPQPSAVSVPLAPGATFEPRQYSGPHGARSYHLYVPSCDKAHLRGLIVMLHGCTQNAQDFAAGTGMNAHAERNNMLVAYPEQTQGHNAQRCWNWFEPGHQSAASGEPALLAGLATELVRDFGLPAGCTFAAGLSAGGAMAAILGATLPDVFRAVGVHSGLAPGAARDVMSAFAAMRGDDTARNLSLPCAAIVFHGAGDTTVAPVNASRLTGTLSDARRTTGTAGGRGYSVTSGKTGEGHPMELWMVERTGHAWSGGSRQGSYADPAGPDASAEMMRFFNMMIESDK
ncbi:hypothetical protein BOO69_00975 [Sulfitobacter alexandrii]|uniref:PHB depolymerase family esterase n=1 Tax=Sulfitobacter alexandrii TaxID=1917485 RepID=A0A1J0WCU1_9RHOB|nr:PHB depolymerase family esterase [Sulfitobacter alexandrii]APE42137.1 hypothetical protein BOO69_00975 [Sulfitobacter alexandrii]